MNRDQKRSERSDDDWEKIAKDLLGVDLSRTQNVDDLDDDPFVPIGALARREEPEPEPPPPAEAASWEPDSTPVEPAPEFSEASVAWESVDDAPAPPAAAGGADDWGADDDFGAGLGLPSAPRETPKRPTPPPRVERPAPRSEKVEREPRPAPRESSPPRREATSRPETPAAESSRPAPPSDSTAEPAERDSFLDALSSWDWNETQGGGSASRGSQGRDSSSRDAEPRSSDRDRPPRGDRGGRRGERGGRGESRGEGRSESRRDEDRPPRRERSGRTAEPREGEPQESPRAEEREPVREEPRGEHRRDRDRPRRESSRGEASRGEGNRGDTPRPEGGRTESGPPDRRERPADRPRRREERSPSVPEDDFGAGLSSGEPEEAREDFEPRRPAGRDAGPREASRRDEEGRGRRRRGRSPGESAESPAPARPDFGRLTEDDEDIFAPSEPFAEAAPPSRPGEPGASVPSRDDDSGRRGRGRGRDRDRRPSHGDESRSEAARSEAPRAPRREFVDEPGAEDAGVAGWNSDVEEDESGLEPISFDDLPTWEEAISYLVSAPRERRPEGDRPPRSSGSGRGPRGEGRDRGRRRRH